MRYSWAITQVTQLIHVLKLDVSWISLRPPGVTSSDPEIGQPSRLTRSCSAPFYHQFGAMAQKHNNIIVHSKESNTKIYHARKIDWIGKIISYDSGNGR